MRTLVCGGGGRADEHCLTAGTAVVLGGTSGGGGRAASGKSLRRLDSIDSNGSTPATGIAACCRFGMLVTGGYHLVSAHVGLIGLKACRKQIEARSGQVTDFGIPERKGGGTPRGGVRKFPPNLARKAARGDLADFRFTIMR